MKIHEGERRHSWCRPPTRRACHQAGARSAALLRAMVVLRPAAPPPNPAAIHELKSRSMSLFRLWLREGLPPLPAFLLKHQVLLQAPLEGIIRVF